MRLRFWAVLAATCAIAFWLRRASDDTPTSTPPRATRASELAEMIRTAHRSRARC